MFIIKSVFTHRLSSSVIDNTRSLYKTLNILTSCLLKKKKNKKNAEQRR
jgi:hypothetical protein